MYAKSTRPSAKREVQKERSSGIKLHTSKINFFFPSCTMYYFLVHVQRALFLKGMSSTSWFISSLVVIVSSPVTGLMQLFIHSYPERVFLFHSNLCLPFLLHPSTVTSRIVPASPSCLSVCPINLSRPLFILAYKLLFSSTKFGTSLFVIISTQLVFL